ARPFDWPRPPAVKPRRTPRAPPPTARPAALVQLRFGPPAPNRLWVANLTYATTWAAFAYVAFLTDAYARRILGWRVASTMTTSTRLHTLEPTLSPPPPPGLPRLQGVIPHKARGSPYPSLPVRGRLAAAGLQPPVRAGRRPSAYAL
ncbi:DDE-type integrase/transposase/recombinase, partial [Mycobacterium tuberculosis]|uniref:DDE-type integrase/transposase/recombinase n=1 Tax=Mycobacterium tuberculosis TaxID=1773 RepID=UPI0039EF0943